MARTEEERASQRTEEYKIKRRIRDKRYREVNKEKIRERYREKHPNARVKLTSQESKKRRREREKVKKTRKFKRNNEWINNYKKSKCCVSCGYKQHPEILHFHHLKGEKKFEISRKKDKSLDTLKTEIEKCILLCPNCHSWLHFDKSKDRIDFINLALIEESNKVK